MEQRNSEPRTERPLFSEEEIQRVFEELDLQDEERRQRILARANNEEPKLVVTTTLSDTSEPAPKA